MHTAAQLSDEFMTKSPTHAISVTAPHFPLPSAPSQLRAAAVHQKTPLLWGSLAVPGKVSNEKADGRAAARVCYTKSSRAIVAGLQGLEIREMAEPKLKQKPLSSQCAAEAILCKECQPSAGKPTGNSQLTSPGEIWSITRQRNGHRLC